MKKYLLPALLLACMLLNLLSPAVYAVGEMPGDTAHLLKTETITAFGHEIRSYSYDASGLLVQEVYQFGDNTYTSENYVTYTYYYGTENKIAYRSWVSKPDSGAETSGIDYYFRTTDSNGNEAVTVRNQDNEETEKYIYDAAGKLLQSEKIYSGGTISTSYTYDAYGNLKTKNEDGSVTSYQNTYSNGQLTEVSFDEYVITYSYDTATALLTEERQTRLDGQSDDSVYVKTYTWEAADSGTEPVEPPVDDEPDEPAVPLHLAFVEEALSYTGMTNAQAKAAGLPDLIQDNWCASFISCVAKNLGLNDIIPFNTGVENMYNDLIRKAGGQDITAAVKSGEIIPQVGDIVFMNSLGHATIICNVDTVNSQYYLVHGNWHWNERTGWRASVVCAPGSETCRNVFNCKTGTGFTFAGQFLQTGTSSLTAIVRPNWDAADAASSAVTTKLDIHCPIDIEISLGSETLSSSAEKYQASFGTLTANDDGSFTALLNYDTGYQVSITGNGEGTADISISYLDEQENTLSSVAFEGVPITPVTSISTSPMIVNNGVELYIYNGSNQLSEAWRAETNQISTGKDSALYDFLTDEDIVLDSTDSGVPATSIDKGSIRPSVTTHSISEVDNGTVKVSPREASWGDIVMITAAPDEGYEIAEVTVTDRRGNEVAVKDKGDGTYTFIMPDSRVTVSVSFAEIPTSTGSRPSLEELLESLAPVNSGTTVVRPVIPARLSYVDVAESAWYYDAVRYVTEKGLMGGSGSAETFQPDQITTRAMVVTILYRLEGEPSVTGAAAFTDVPAGQYYTNAVAWAVKNRIVNGYGETFAPDQAITRQELAAMLYRYAAYKGYNVSARADLSAYTDAEQIGSFAAEAMGWANAAGLITGDTAVTLTPQSDATRATVATILMRFCENTAK